MAKPSKRSRWGVSLGAAILSGLVGCGQLGSGSAEGYGEPVDEHFGSLNEELLNQFPDRLRLSRFNMNVDRGQFGERKYTAIRGSIPMGIAVVRRRDLCDRRTHPYCTSVAFGEELLAQSETRTEIEAWLAQPCEGLPANPTESGTFFRLQDRLRAVTALRSFMGCGTSPKEPRLIFVHIVRNFDDVFNGDSSHTDRVLATSIVETRIITIN